ncbi:hypothetical protein B2I21_07270 [Chryseobacterium mucoviscidosis]|uniref:Uncharacterized protein n=1 Tax=Tetzosporium hominis TaxID=2020506 RepID=A0A264W793_9BACL|nr:hypothetical protein [Tetzosporium hominis]OPG99071.1 hypothetical protein B2I21_07270 [Chryseobacterium mucoviscidosis]OZS79468.1 hypothetical protein CF394_00760 [Tetzosporium hominis]
MRNYRKDLGNLALLCGNLECQKLIIIHKDAEVGIKAGRLITCHECRCIAVITQELEDYVKQTRCYT